MSAELKPLLVDARAAARLCGLGLRTWYTRASAGQVPAPVRIGGRVLWRVADLEVWVAAGCPVPPVGPYTCALSSKER